MAYPRLLAAVAPFVFSFTLAQAPAQIQPYPKARTDKAVQPETPMSPPPVNTPFVDRDFGETMVRATDPATNNFDPHQTFFRTEASGDQNSWSADSKKFYVIVNIGYILAFAFNPSTMKVSSLAGAAPGEGLILPFHEGPTFSFVNPDLVYGTTTAKRLTISAYHFSTGELSAVLDTTTCGTVPAIGSGTGPMVSNDVDLSISADDSRMSISEVGQKFGQRRFLIVYDKALGCRWYNTQTGQIGGKWGATGLAIGPTTPYAMMHSKLSLNGHYIKIQTATANYVWDVATLNVLPCMASWHCSGYAGTGYSSWVNSEGTIDDMNIVKHPLSDVSRIEPLVWPLLPPYHWDQEHHSTWSNDTREGLPVCLSNYNSKGDPTIRNAYDDEIICIETDLAASTIWRFAHTRAVSIYEYFNTQPLGSISKDGRFFLFTSTWDQQLGQLSNGRPRSDAWIVHLQ
jgi:hypothetical protein